jgi:hypothetical protein
MHNYYNIIPIILIDVFIILVFEGILFFLYLAQQQENIINNKLDDVMIQINESKKTLNTTYQLLFSYISNIIQPHIENNMAQEQYNNEKNYKLGLIIFIATLVFIIIGLLIYSYIVINILGKTIEWKTVFITVFITIVLIVILELLYVKYILFNKKFNESQIELDFINAFTT